MIDEQQTPDETPDDRLLAALEAIANRGHEGLTALLADILEGRAATDGQPLGDAADRPALVDLARRRGWTTWPRQQLHPPAPEPVGRPVPKSVPGLGDPSEVWARHLGIAADTTTTGHPLDQEHP